MTNDLVYLKKNVVPEPLIARWYAWPHLISPATAAMNITERHLKIINSYIQAPHIHAATVKNPQMKGGPFMDFGDKVLVDDINWLKESVLSDQQKMIELATAIKTLNKMLMVEAKGYSLNSLYEKVPDILKGYVELIYDVNNQPSFRFFEPLLYKSQFFDSSYQSVYFHLIEQDERPFVLSTPRILCEEGVHLNIPFGHPGIDELFKMQRVPKSFSHIKTILGIEAQQMEAFENFFTNEAPELFNKYEGDGVRTRYFGHACILIETKEISILSDPVISYGYDDAEILRYTYTDLPDVIDYVIITHNHQDHILLETMLQLRHKIKTIIVPKNGGGNLQDPNLKLMFNQIGFNNVIEIGEFDKIEMAHCTITGLPFIGEHADLDIRAKLCHHVQLEHLSILFVADSCNVEPKIYEHVQNLIGCIDVLFLGMECDGAPLSWLYGPLMTYPLERDKDQSRRLAGSNYEMGIDLVNRFRPKEVYVYAMGQEPWLNYIMTLKYTDQSNPIIDSNKLIKECQEQGIVCERLFGEKEILYLDE